LPEKDEALMLDVSARAPIGEPPGRHLGQPKGFIELPEGRQTCIRSDGCSPELQLEPPVEIEPKRPFGSFTHRVISTTGREERLTH
jgi:hypothetical protein